MTELGLLDSSMGSLLTAHFGGGGGGGLGAKPSDEVKDIVAEQAKVEKWISDLEKDIAKVGEDYRDSICMPSSSSPSSF